MKRWERYAWASVGSFGLAVPLGHIMLPPNAAMAFTLIMWAIGGGLFRTAYILERFDRNDP